LLLSDARRVSRTLSRIFRTNPLVLTALLTAALTIGILGACSGDVLAALASSRAHGLTTLTVAVVAVGAALGCAGASGSPRLSAFDGQFRASPVPRHLIAVPLLLVPVALMLAAPSLVISRAFLDAYDSLQAEPSRVWALLFAVWFVNVGIAGAATSALFSGDRQARLVGVLFLISIALVGLGGSTLVGAPAWAWLSPFVPWGPTGTPAGLVRPDEWISCGAALAGGMAACAALVWAKAREPGSSIRFRSQMLPLPSHGAALALGQSLAAAALRSPRARWLLFAPALGALAGLAIRASGERDGLLGSFLVAGLLLAAGEVAISLSREYRLGRWLADSSPAAPWSRAFGWILGAGAVALGLGLLAVSPLLLLGGAGLNELAWIGSSTFAVVFAGRLIPWDHRSNGMQFLSSITAGVCVIAALALDVWLVGALGPGAGHTLALLTTGLSASAAVLGMEVGKDR